MLSKRNHHSGAKIEFHGGDLSVESRIPESVRKQLLARGHKLTVTGAWSDQRNA